MFWRGWPTNDIDAGCPPRPTARLRHINRITRNLGERRAFVRNSRDHTLLTDLENSGVTDMTFPSSPVVVITGASAGVGRATAVAFAQRGFNVGLIARGADGLEGARRDVEAAGGRALVLPVDVAEASAVFAAADRVTAEWGKIDVWINAAMATIFAPVKDIKPDEFRRVTEVCVSAPDRDPGRNRTITLIFIPKYEEWWGPNRRRLGPPLDLRSINNARGIAEPLTGSRFGA